MRNLPSTPTLFCLVCLFLCLPGCQLFYRYRPVGILVRDAETKKPIAEADIHLSYPLTRDSLAPFDSFEKTGTDGIAHLLASPFGDFGVVVNATANGYMPENLNVSTDLIQHIEPAHPFEAVQKRPADFVIEMYPLPKFAVELIVPRGYCGLIKAEIQLQADVAAPPGERCFRYPVNENNSVLVNGPTILSRVYPSDYHASYTDGTPLSDEMSLVKVGFRWLRGEGKEQYFVVGTKAEYDLYRRTIPSEAPAQEHHRSDGGRGGRQHRSETATK